MHVRLIYLLPVSMAFISCATQDDAYRRLREETWRPSSEYSAAADSLAGAESTSQSGNDVYQADELVLGDLLEEVQRRNPTLESAEHAWRAALARYPQVTSLDDPTFSYGLAPLTLDRPKVGAEDNRLDVGQRFELTQRFPWPEKRALRGEAALQEARGMRYDLETVRQLLLRETKYAYFDYWYVQQAIEINAQYQTLFEQLGNVAQRRYEAGRGSKQDVLQADVEHNRLRQEALALVRMRRVAVAVINALLNLAPDAPLPEPPIAVPSDVVEPPGSDALREAALEIHPELQALGSRVAAKETNVKLARKEFYPDFSVMGGYNSLWREDEQRPLLGFSINLPIQLGRRRAALDQAKAEQSKLVADLARRKSEIQRDVQVAYEGTLESARTVTLYRAELLPVVRENLEAALTEYRAGQVDFLALVTAQRQVMSTELNLNRTIAEYHQRRADLARAVGKPLDAIPEEGGQ